MENEDMETEITWSMGDYRVKMNPVLDKKLKFLSNNYSHEIAGWLVGERTDEGYEIEDILIPKQEVTGGSVDIEAAAQVELLKQFGARCQKIIGHWHSHCKMGTFWSGIDETAMEELSEPRDGYLFIVTSKNIHKCRVYFDHILDLKLDNVPVIVEEDEEEFAELIETISTNVTEKTYSKPKKSHWDNNNDLYENNSAYNKNLQYSRRMNISPTEGVTLIDKELLHGIHATYVDKELIIDGLQDEELEAILEKYKSFDPDTNYLDENGLNEFRVRIKKRDKAEDVVEDMRIILMANAYNDLRDVEGEDEQQIMGGI